ncbi:MAG: hypothetical protein GQ524_00215 [Anaerolineales bacterium]|nr:hypothetical protein [Anaerolineales bacterium]
MWSAEALLPVAGAACALSLNLEIGHAGSYGWIKTTSSVIARRDQEFSFGRDNAAQICQVTHTI